MSLRKQRNSDCSHTIPKYIPVAGFNADSGAGGVVPWVDSVKSGRPNAGCRQADTKANVHDIEYPTHLDLIASCTAWTANAKVIKEFPPTREKPASRESLTDAEVIAIMELIERGEKPSDIKRRYRVKDGTFKSIKHKRGKRYQGLAKLKEERKANVK